MKTKGTEEVEEKGWPRRICEGREVVTVYKRAEGFRIADYSTPGVRKFRSYADEATALSEARTLAKRLAKGQVIAARMTDAGAAEYASAIQSLAPHGVGLISAADTLAAVLKVVGNLENLRAAADAWVRDHRNVTRKPLADVVNEFITQRGADAASRRYLADLRSRLDRFTGAVRKDACDVSGRDVQGFLDSLKLAPQSRKNYRTVIFSFFEYAVSRGFGGSNPVAKTEAVKVRSTGDVAIYTPAEYRRLLEAATPEFLPLLVLGGLAGLRTAELERVGWENIDFDAGHIALSAEKTKTAARRVVPLCAAARAWLAPYRGKRGLVWAGHGKDMIFDAQLECSTAARVKWKGNALRHSFGSYRFSILGDAGRVAGEMGNSPGVVHKHYRELVKPAEAAAWFAILPATDATVIAGTAFRTPEASVA